MLFVKFAVDGINARILCIIIVDTLKIALELVTTCFVQAYNKTALYITNACFELHHLSNHATCSYQSCLRSFNYISVHLIQKSNTFSFRLKKNLEVFEDNSKLKL